MRQSRASIATHVAPPTLKSPPESLKWGALEANLNKDAANNFGWGSSKASAGPPAKGEPAPAPRACGSQWRKLKASADPPNKDGLTPAPRTGVSQWGKQRVGIGLHGKDVDSSTPTTLTSGFLSEALQTQNSGQLGDGPPNFSEVIARETPVTPAHHELRDASNFFFPAHHGQITKHDAMPTQT